MPPQQVLQSGTGTSQCAFNSACCAASAAASHKLSAALRRFQTLYEIFSELSRAGGGLSVKAERRPVLLLLGGGMAAGKSTVREVIGHDDFWSKVRCQLRLVWRTCMRCHVFLTFQPLPR